MLREWGNVCGKRKDQPEVIISSSAVRAQTTARTFWPLPSDFPTSDIAIDERLYGAEPEDVLSIIGGFG